MKKRSPGKAAPRVKARRRPRPAAPRARKRNAPQARKRNAPQARYRDVLDALMQGVAMFDAAQRLSYHNARFAELMGFPDGFLRIGVSLPEIVAVNRARGVKNHARPHESLEDLATRVAAAKSAVRVELEMPDGSVLALRHVPLRGGGFVNTYTTITSRTQAEDEARRNLKLLQDVLGNMADGVRVFDKDLRLIAFNEKSFEMKGVPKELRRIGVTYDELTAFHDRRGDYADLDSDPAEQREARIQRARAGIGRSSIQRFPNGRVIQKRRNPMPGGGFVSTYTDVTDLKRTESELRDAIQRAELANRAKSQFLANMSHELRTPLNAIIGFAELIHGQIQGPIGVPCYSDYARDIRDAGVHLLNIINDLLDLSKIEAGKAELQEQAVDLRRSIESCVRLLAERARLGNISVAVGDVPAGLRLRADHRMLKQILVKLLSNAIKFTPPGGHAAIRAWRETDGGLVIAVSDTGIGIAPENIEKALTPFQQVDGALNRVAEGTGLGLPLVKSLAELHDGALSIESQVGVGTTVTVRLPAARVLERAA